MATVEVSPNHFSLDKASDLAKDTAKEITWFSAPFSPKEVPRFYDISSIIENPVLFQRIIDALAARYRALGDERPTHIVGYDARGFLIGTPLALALGLPFVMLRKKDKSPGVLLRSMPYSKEYQEEAPDTMVLRVGALPEGSRVVLVDDLIATGGTAISGFELVHAAKSRVVEFLAIIAIPVCDGITKIREFHGGRFKDVSIMTLIEDEAISDDSCADPVGWPEGKPRVIDAAQAE